MVVRSGNLVWSCLSRSPEGAWTMAAGGRLGPVGSSSGSWGLPHLLLSCHHSLPCSSSAGCLGCWLQGRQWVGAQILRLLSWGRVLGHGRRRCRCVKANAGLATWGSQHLTAVLVPNAREELSGGGHVVFVNLECLLLGVGREAACLWLLSAGHTTSHLTLTGHQLTQQHN